MYRKVAAALVAALALGIAGCGGSESELTRAQLVRRVETACRQGQQVADREQRAAGRGRGMEVFIDSVAAGQQAILDRIGDLNVPDELQDDFDALRSGMQERLDLLERAGSVDRAELERAVRGIQQQAEAATRRIAAAGRTLGIEGCS